jgi:hypothetical protein
VLGELLLCVYPSAGATSMHLASDHIHPYKDAGGRLAQRRVRIYLPDDIRDAPVVICSELPNKPGGSITNSAETIAAGVLALVLLALTRGRLADRPEAAREPRVR